MSSILTHRATISKSILRSELADELVFLNLDDENYYGLDDVGVRVWKLIEEHGDLRTVYETLLEEYEVDRTQLLKDMENLVQQLVQAGLIHLEIKSRDTKKIETTE